MMARSQVSLTTELQREAYRRAAELGISFAEYVRNLSAGDLAHPTFQADPHQHQETTTMIEAGQTFPSFELPDQSGELKSLGDLVGDKGLVLYVYPKDNTPGCTTEATDFRDRLEDFRGKGYEVAGISKDSAASHCKFIDKYELTFPLLTDADGSFLESIGAFGEKKNYGRIYKGIIRSTFVVGPDGEVVHALRNVRAKGHAERVLGEL